MSRDMKFVLPIRESTRDNLLQALEQFDQDYQYVEIWLDYVENLELSLARELMAAYQGRLILVMRREGARSKNLTLTDISQLLDIAGTCSTYLDFDLEHERECFVKLRDQICSSRLILSHHNFELTPNKDSLRAIAAEALDMGAGIVKLATYCRSPSDALTLLALSQEFQRQNIRHVVLGMGEYGAITRVFGSLWSNEWVYAPVDENKSTAKGQLTRGQLSRIFEVLK